MGLTMRELGAGTKGVVLEEGDRGGEEPDSMAGQRGTR